MLERLWRGPDRRRHPRIETSFAIEVRVEMFGFEDDSRPFFARGHTRNVSLGGILADVDAPVAPGAVCKIFFREADAHVEPGCVAGRVLRCHDHDSCFQLAIAFDEPLERLDAPVAVESVEIVES